MKKIFFLTIILIVHIGLFAQKQKIEFDKKTKKIKLDNEIVGSIETLSGGGLLDPISTYSIKDNTDKEVMLAKVSETVLDITEVTFIKSNQKAYPDVIDRKGLAKYLVRNGVLTKNGFSEEGEKRFVTLYAEKPMINVPNNNIGNNTIGNNNNNTTLLERNRQASISIYGDDVQQDFKSLGRISNNNEMIGGNIMTIYKILNHEGKKIAEAMTELNGKSIRVTTLKDNIVFTLQAKDMSTSTIKEVIANYLVQRYYW